MAYNILIRAIFMPVINKATPPTPIKIELIVLEVFCDFSKSSKSN